MPTDPEFDVGEVLREFDAATRNGDGEAVDGDTIKNFTLIERIGEGGFGSVWRARQENPVRRNVAVKILKSGMDTREVLARFERERQVLALMDHPEIAKVFDAGMTESGRPFFAMELVENGVPVTTFCRETNPGLPERLQLFSRICSAIQHAHRKGVIHRDLKPSNLLVSVGDDEPQVKVIDFGIAKATRDESLADLTVLTRMDRIMGTPAYMSPESLVEGRTSDTRSDVYSLGVVLYELLTGTTPLELAKTDHGTDVEWAKIVRENMPKRPSTVSIKKGDVAPEAFRSELKGDLDRIVLKAVDPEPDRRYGSPEDLADDIARFLNHEPVEAQDRSNFYLAKRFAQRHRTAVIGAAGILLALFVGLAVSATLFLREKEARKLADIEVERAQQITQILEETLQSAGYSKSLGRDTTILRDILDSTAERVDSELKNRPVIEAEIRRILGETYLDIDNYSQSEAQFRRSVELLRETEPDSVLMAKTILGLAEVIGDGKKPDEAEPFLHESISILEANGLEGSPLWHRARMELAWRYLESGRPVLGEEMAKQGYLAWLKDPNNEYLGHGAIPYQTILRNTGRSEEAEESYRESIAVLRKNRNTLDVELNTTLDNFGTFLIGRGKVDEAEDILTEALETGREIFGDRSPNEDHILASLARIEAIKGNAERELKLLRDAVAVSARVYESGHRYRIAPVAQLIKALFRQADEALLAGDTSAAEERLSELETLASEQTEVKLDPEELEALREKIAKN